MKSKWRKTPSLRRKTQQPATALITPAPLVTPKVAVVPLVPALPVVTVKPVPLSAWQLSGEAVIGLAHRRKGLVCQDAVAWRQTARPILALSDGAGSAVVSELGAAALVSGISRFLMSMEDALAPWLDGEGAHSSADTNTDLGALWSARLLAHAQGILEDLAQAQRRSVRDVRGTLLVAVVGQVRTFWWQVGDGAAVVQYAHGLRVLGDTRHAKGEFANQTCFVDIARAADVQCGVLPSAEVFGLALMSDGGAEKLVAHDGSRVAGRLNEWLSATVEQRLPPDKIALAFHEPAMWERTSLDDRSIVLLARLRPQEPSA